MGTAQRSASRHAFFAAAAVFLSVLTLELGCFVVLGFIEEDPGETSRDPSAWLVNAQQAFERGFYRPDRHAL